MRASVSPWRCPCCGGPIDPVTFPACDGCGVRHRALDGIPLLVSRPDAHLASVKRRVLGEWARLQMARSRHADSPAEGGRDERARRAFAARSHNQALMQQLAAPVLSAASAPDGSLTAFFTERGVGWALDDLFAYFWVDWATTPPYRQAAGAVLDAATRCASRRSAVVLGCGAGRLLLDLASEFEHVRGVDLSLLSLFLAARLLRGGEARFFMPTADWRDVRLKGPERPPANVELVAADAGRLPFADGSHSFVATQYLLDVVPDPVRVAREINRILEPGGTWFNLGLPFRLPSDPPELPSWTVEDMPAFVASAGFEVRDVRRVTHTHLDLRALDPSATSHVHAPIRFSARKVGDVPVDPGRRALEQHARGNGSALMSLVPRFQPGRRVSIGRTTVRGPGSPRTVHEIGWREHEPRIPVTESSFRFMEALCAALDGRRTIGAITADVLAAMPRMAEPADVIAALEQFDALGLIILG